MLRIKTPMVWKKRESPIIGVGPCISLKNSTPHHSEFYLSADGDLLVRTNCNTNVCHFSFGLLQLEIPLFFIGRQPVQACFTEEILPSASNKINVPCDILCDSEWKLLMWRWYIISIFLCYFICFCEVKGGGTPSVKGSGKKDAQGRWVYDHNGNKIN